MNSNFYKFHFYNIGLSTYDFFINGEKISDIVVKKFNVDLKFSYIQEKNNIIYEIHFKDNEKLQQKYIDSFYNFFSQIFSQHITKFEKKTEIFVNTLYEKIKLEKITYSSKESNQNIFKI